MLSGGAWHSNLAGPQWELEANNSKERFLHKEPHILAKTAGLWVHWNSAELL